MQNKKVISGKAQTRASKFYKIVKQSFSDLMI